MNVSNLKKKEKIFCNFCFSFYFFFNSFQQPATTYFSYRKSFRFSCRMKLCQNPVCYRVKQAFLLCLIYIQHSIALCFFFYYLLECSVHNFHKVEEIVDEKVQIFQIYEIGNKRAYEMIDGRYKEKIFISMNNKNFWIFNSFSFEIIYSFFIKVMLNEIVFFSSFLFGSIKSHIFLINCYLEIGVLLQQMTSNKIYAIPIFVCV